MNNDPIAPTQSAVRNEYAVAIAPPSSVPSGIVPQTIQRIDAFIRPCIRSGVIACRRLTCEMLYAIAPNPNTNVPTSSTGTGKLAGASGHASNATDENITGIQIAPPTPTAFWIRGVPSAPTIEPMP